MLTLESIWFTLLEVAAAIVVFVAGLAVVVIAAVMVVVVVKWNLMLFVVYWRWQIENPFLFCRC